MIDKIKAFLNTDLIQENINNTMYKEYEFDDCYNSQLNGYRQAIKERTKKEVDCFLYSILEEKYKKISL